MSRPSRMSRFPSAIPEPNSGAIPSSGVSRRAPLARSSWRARVVFPPPGKPTVRCSVGLELMGSIVAAVLSSRPTVKSGPVQAAPELGTRFRRTTWHGPQHLAPALGHDSEEPLPRRQVHTWRDDGGAHFDRLAESSRVPINFTRVHQSPGQLNRGRARGGLVSRLQLLAGPW